MPWPPGKAPGSTGQDAATKDGAAKRDDAVAERRLSTDTGNWYTLAELHKEYRDQYTPKEIEEYWEKNMLKEQDDCTAGEDSGGKSWVREQEVPTLPCEEVTLEDHNGEQSRCRYVLLKPSDFEARVEPWPVLLFLHGHGEIDRPALLCSLIVGEDALLDSFVLDEFVVLAPLAHRGGALLDSGGHDFAVDAVHQLAQEAIGRLQPRVDPARLSVTGYSMGADGALLLAARHGRSLAAVAAFAGAYSGLWRERWEAAFESFSSVAIRCYHNEGDNYLWSRNTVTTVQWIGNPFGMEPPEEQKVSIPVSTEGAQDTGSVPLHLAEYQWGRKASLLFAVRKEKEVQDHDCWTFVYRNEATFGLFGWMLSCRSVEACNNKLAQPPIVTVQDARLDQLIQKWLTKLWPQGTPSPGSPLLGQAHLELSLRLAVEWLSRADAVLVLAGRALSSCMGLPTCCGGEAGDWPALEALDKTQHEVCTYSAVRQDAALAWGCWLHSIEACRAAEPRRCQRLLHEWAHPAPWGCFCINAAVDGSWSRAGWPAEQLVEARGAVERLQCVESCSDETWLADADLSLTEDSRSHRAVGPLPVCPRCGAGARPTARMYGGGWEGSLLLPKQQLERYSAWHEALQEKVLPGRRQDSAEAGLLDPEEEDSEGSSLLPARGTIACIELGCTASELAALGLNWMIRDFRQSLKLIRVCPEDVETPDAWAGGTVFLPTDMPAVFDRLSELMGAMGRATFIVSDEAGNGAEFTDRQDATRERIWRRTLAELGDETLFTEEVSLEACHPVVDGHVVALPDSTSEVPVRQFHAQDDLLPMVRIKVSGHSFSGQNEPLRDRMQQVCALFSDLLAVFGLPAYQECMQSAEDAEVIKALIREVHMQVLPRYGFDLNHSMSAAQVYRTQLRMQAFVKSGMVTPVISELGVKASALAGSQRMETLRQVRRKTKATDDTVYRPSDAEIRAFVESLTCRGEGADEVSGMPSVAELLAQLDEEEGE